MFTRKAQYIRMTPILIATIIGILLVIDTSGAGASHASWGHNIYMHSSSHHEYVCTDAQNSTMSQGAVLWRVKNTLRYGNPSSDWHQLAGNKVYFIFNNTSCSYLPSYQ